MENSYLLSGEEALKYFEVSEDTGLSDPQVNALRERYGDNGMATSTGPVAPVMLTLTVCSVTGRPSNADVATHTRAVQRPTRHHPAGLGGGLLHPGPVRRG